MNTLKDEPQSTLNDMGDTAKKAVEKGSDELQKSGKEWLDYVKTHPLQSVLFGIVGFYALKGLIKN